MHCVDLATTHLLLRLRPINRALRAAVARQAEAAAQLERPDLSPLCVTDQHVELLLDGVDSFLDGEIPRPGQFAALNADESAFEEELRNRAAGTAGSLPLDVLQRQLGLGHFETQAILICAAPELDRSYERIFAYIMDDLNRRFACVELLCDLTAENAIERLARRRLLSPFGRLRRCGLLESFGEITTGSRTQLRPGPGVLEFLSGSSSGAVGLWHDSHEIDLSGAPRTGQPSDMRIGRIGNGIASGAINLVGIWGEADSGPQDVAILIARTAGRPLRQMSMNDLIDIVNSLHTAALEGAILHVPVDALHDSGNQAAAAIVRCLTACDLPVLLTGAEPWRPTPLLATRTYAEIELKEPCHVDRTAIWSAVLPQGNPGQLRDIAGRFRLSTEEITAAARFAQSQSAIESNGKLVTPDETLESACRTVVQKTRSRFVVKVKPRRGPADLILPPDLHRQVLEIADFTRVLPTVSDGWGFGRLTTGGAGVKCLFTGDPGTGKTLCAEVVACQLGVPLLKVNIGDVVSKWVGETEKNLDAAFCEAAACHGLLFFDEADALFGKRGEVRHGVDRYANLEVGHLLQRFEDHDGPVVLASNLKDNIDPAFTRRFHVVLHLPRPDEANRRQIWQIAFPAAAPLEQKVDLALLARLDMTGAGIVNAARTAALLAAREGSQRITITHVVHGIARQFRREARILSMAELGPYASLLQVQS